MANNIKTALDILKDEVHGDVEAALKKMHPDYAMTWVNYSFDRLFRRVSRKDSGFGKLIASAYAIKGRKYDIKHIVANDDTVMIELIESYESYVTPLVLVLEFKNGKIIRGRHYYDPQVSEMELSKKQVNKIYK